MTESWPAATVHVGLDVHAASIRLAAVRADELLDERTRAHDSEAVARAVSRWPRVRCCYEAGPTGHDLARQLRARGIACAVVAPGLVPVPVTGSRPIGGTRASSPGCTPAGSWKRSRFPASRSRRWRDLVRAREDARIDRMRDRHRMSKFLLRHGLRMPNKSWGTTRRKWLGSLTFGYGHQQQAWSSPGFVDT